MSKTILLSWGLVVFLVLSLGLLAYDNTSASQSALPATISTTQVTTSRLSPDKLEVPMGSYITSLKAKDFHFELYEELPALRKYIGRWELQFTDQGRFSVKFNNQLQVEGTYALTADVLSFTSAKWPSLCQTYEAPTTTSYHWQIESGSKSLNLLGKSDLCNVAGTVLLMHELMPLKSTPVPQ